EEGYVYICDRKKDMIISGGVNIYPAEIEAVLYAHPQVLDAAVFGIPDEEWGERVHAIVQPKPDQAIDLDELRAFAEPRLARYKHPRAYEVRDELPRTDSGKLLKRGLRARSATRSSSSCAATRSPTRPSAGWCGWGSGTPTRCRRRPRNCWRRRVRRTEPWSCSSRRWSAAHGSSSRVSCATRSSDR